MTQPIQQVVKVQAKPGFKTTEFVKSAIIDIVGLLTTVGEIKPTGNPKWDSIISAAAAISVAINNFGYVKSRAIVKSAATYASTPVVPVTSDVINPDTLGGV